MSLSPPTSHRDPLLSVLAALSPASLGGRAPRAASARRLSLSPASSPCPSPRGRRLVPFQCRLGFRGLDGPQTVPRHPLGASLGFPCWVTMNEAATNLRVRALRGRKSRLLRGSVRRSAAGRWLHVVAAAAGGLGFSHHPGVPLPSRHRQHQGRVGAAQTRRCYDRSPVLDTGRRTVQGPPALEAPMWTHARGWGRGGRSRQGHRPAGPLTFRALGRVSCVRRPPGQPLCNTTRLVCLACPSPSHPHPQRGWNAGTMTFRLKRLTEENASVVSFWNRGELREAPFASLTPVFESAHGHGP